MLCSHPHHNRIKSRNEPCAVVQVHRKQILIIIVGNLQTPDSDGKTQTRLRTALLMATEVVKVAILGDPGVGLAG